MEKTYSDKNQIKDCLNLMVEGGFNIKGYRETFGVVKMCYTFIMMVVTQVYKFVRLHKCTLKWVHFTMCK